MPSVEMRRTTRVFGARVLRSGRRLFPTQDVNKHMKRPPLAAADVEDDWIDLLDHGGHGGGGGDVGLKDNGWRNSNGEDKEIDDGVIKLGKSKGNEINSDVEIGTGNNRWGVVYSRKRKRTESIGGGNLDKKFGKKFSRKQSGKKTVTEDLQPSVASPKVNTTTKLRLSSKSRKKKTTGVAVAASAAKPTRLNLPNLPSRQTRSSLRSTKQSDPSSLVQDGVPFFPIKSNAESSRSTQKVSFKELKESTQDLDSASCNASILVIKSDRCYREKEAVITVQMSSSNQWFFVVKRNGVEKFRVETQNVMKPCYINRVTHAIIWPSGDESWRLEFPNRQDWAIFKELYKECYERTLHVQDSVASSIIPVPQVNEVSGYADETCVPFKMPDLYISSRGDEVFRILEKTDPVYDMDSDDDEWLNECNAGRDSRVDEDTFEKIIDAFERGMFCSPGDYSDVTKAADLCLNLASKDVLEAVYGYWTDKRKKKRSALVRAFELYKQKKPERPNFKAVLRKKRSFRQRGAQSGRGKKITFLKAALYDKTQTEAEEAENVSAKVQENEEAANRATQVAIMKRERAQVLMEVADLLAYKASIALKIAEARAMPVDDDNNNNIDELFLPVDNAGFT
ncbi:uncharacterized protein LOC143620058 [Bidens hawaiensis]|uniref:uncharacterized protein LOC143620058 n=1 Tax=Bidens hawaiensis TaxID=980011 RepID=UPI004049AEA6